MKPEQYKIMDNGIWIPLEELKRLCDSLDVEGNAERRNGNSRGASILFGRSLSFSELLLMVEDAGKAEKPQEAVRICKPRLAGFIDTVRRYVNPRKGDAFCSRSELLGKLKELTKLIE